MRVSMLPAAALLATAAALPAMAQQAPRVTAAIDLHLGVGPGTVEVHNDIDLSSDEQFRRELAAVGAGRIAFRVAPAFSIEIDAWTNMLATTVRGHSSAIGDYDDSFTDVTGGLGAHATLRLDGLSLGVLGSVGAVGDEGLFGNAAGELVLGGDRLRLYGQAGYAMGLSSYARTDGLHDLYARAELTVYATPNLGFSANIGADRFGDDFAEDARTTVTFGGRVEFKPDALPFSIYAGYEGDRWGRTDDAGDVVAARQNTVLVGLRFAIGATTLRDLDDAVGLLDANPMFGTPFSHER